MDSVRDLVGNQWRMRIYVGESAHVRGRSFSAHVLELARQRKLAGCTVYRAISGFGANSVLRTSELLELSTDLPLVLEIVDERPHLDGLLAELEPHMASCLVTFDSVEVRHYRAAKK